MPVSAAMEAEIKALLTERFGSDPDCYRIVSRDDAPSPDLVTYVMHRPLNGRPPVRLKSI